MVCVIFGRLFVWFDLSLVKKMTTKPWHQMNPYDEIMIHHEENSGQSTAVNTAELVPVGSSSLVDGMYSGEAIEIV